MSAGTAREIVAFRLHLPSRIRWHNSRNLDSDTPRDPSRGNILTWEQRLTDRLDGKPIAWSEDHTPGVMEVRMDNQSILYRTLWLFGLAFLAAVVVLVLLDLVDDAEGASGATRDRLRRAFEVERLLLPFAE